MAVLFARTLKDAIVDEVLAQVDPTSSYFGSVQFPHENGLSTDPLGNAEFRLAGANTGDMAASGTGALWYGSASVVAFVDPAHEREDALNYNATVIGNVSSAETGVRGFRLAYVTGWNSTTARQRTFRFYIRGETATSAAWAIASAQLPYTAKGPFAVLVYNDGTNGYCHVYDIPTATWHDGGAVAKPAGWAGVVTMTNPLGIGGEYTGTFPKDNSSGYHAAVQFRGALGDILLANAALSKANVESIVNGAAPVTTATGAGATAYLHIPFVDGAGAQELAVTTTYTGMTGGLTQYGSFVPGPTMRRQATSAYVTLDRFQWPAFFARESGAECAAATLTGTVTGVTGELQVRQVSRDGVALTDWQTVPHTLSGTAWTAKSVPIAPHPDFWQMQARFTGDTAVVAVSHSTCLTGAAIRILGQSETVGAVMGSYSSSGVAGSLNVLAKGRTDTVIYGVIGDNAQSPSGFVHMRHALRRQGTIRDAAMTIANAIRRRTDEPHLLLLDAISGTSLVDLMDESQTSRTKAVSQSLGALAMNRGRNGEYVLTGEINGGWEAFSGAVNVFSGVYKAWFTGIGETSGSTDSTRILQSDLDFWAYDGTFSPNREYVVLPPNRTTTGSTATTTDAGTEADQRDHFRNYAHIYGFRVGPETTTHKMEGEVSSLPTGTVTHATSDWDGYVEMAESFAEGMLMASGHGQYAGPVFFESIRAGTTSAKVIVKTGEPRPMPGNGLSEGSTGYSTATQAIERAGAINLHVKTQGGDPGAGFEARRKPSGGAWGSWAKTNVTSGSIINAREVELTTVWTLASGDQVEVRYHPGAPGNYSDATITQDNWRAGALFYSGEQHATGEPASDGDTGKLGWAVSGSNQALALTI